MNGYHKGFIFGKGKAERGLANGAGHRRVSWIRTHVLCRDEIGTEKYSHAEPYGQPMSKDFLAPLPDPRGPDLSRKPCIP